MNILCIDQFAAWGGGQRSFLDLLPSFRAQGWEPHVALPGEGRFRDELCRLGYATSNLPSGDFTSIRKPLSEIFRYALDLPKVTRHIAKLANQIGADLIYVNGPRFLPHAALVARAERIPLVFHCHHLLGQGSAIRIVGDSLRLTNAFVIACCEHAVRPVSSFIHASRLSVIYNGVLNPENVQPRRLRTIRRIGVIGRIEREKGQLDFIHAARNVAKQFDHCDFAVIGSPMFSDSTYYREVVAASHGLPVRFIDWQEDIARVFGELDLVVVPSTPLESTTRVILEAFAFGVPVVAMPSGGIPEVVKDNETGFLANAGNAEALAQRIVSVLEMPLEEVEALAAKAHNVWQERYTLSRYRNEVCNVFAQAVCSRSTVERRGLSPVYTASAKTDQ